MGICCEKGIEYNYEGDKTVKKIQNKEAERKFFNEKALPVFFKLREKEVVHGADKIFELLGLSFQPTPSLLLDVGAGFGSMSFAIKTLNYNVIALDYSDKCCKLIQARNKRLRASVPVVQGDAEWLPFRANSFNRVFVFQVVHHFPDCQDVLKELFRVTKEELLICETNGSNIISRISQFIRHIPPVINTLSETGGTTINEITHPHNTYLNTLKKLRPEWLKCIFADINYIASYSFDNMHLYPCWIRGLIYFRKYLFIVVKKFLPLKYTSGYILFRIKK